MLTPIHGHVEIVARHVAAALMKPARKPNRRLTFRERVMRRFEGGNVYVRGGGLDYLKFTFSGTGAPATPTLMTYPWRVPSQYDGTNMSTRAGGLSTGPVQYPVESLTLAERDASRLRFYPTAAMTIARANQPRVIGAVGMNNGTLTNDVGAEWMTVSDVAMTMVGTVYQHRSTGAGSAVFTAGQGYFTQVSIVASNLYLYLMPRVYSYVRVTTVTATGATAVNAGVYRVRHIDKTNNRVYLVNLDGSPFVASATETVSIGYGPTPNYFNEEGVVPISAGRVYAAGIYNPGENRTSYLFRLNFAKTGSPTPADASQRGTYWFTTRPYTYGLGTSLPANNYMVDADHGGVQTSAVRLHGDVLALHTPPPGGMAALTAGFAGGCPGMWLDRTNQRMWGIATDGAQGDIWWWRYKSPESLNEVATSTGTAANLIAGIAMGGTTPRAIDGDDENSVYVALTGGGNAGVVKITSDLVATQWKANTAGLATTVSGLKVDRTRARSGGANTVTTTAASNALDCADGAFTQADVGRAIVITSGADAGTYLITTVVDADSVTVTTLAGAAVAFTGQAATGSWRIGSRIYIFWNDTTSWAGTLATQIKIVYMESVAFGTVLRTPDLAVTANGRQVALATGYTAPIVAVDPTNGNLYWYSTDTTVRLNRYDVTAQTVSQKLLSDFSTPAGGSGTIVTPTAVYAIAVNPNTYFREVWLGTNQGFVRIGADVALGSVKSTWTAGLSSEAALADGTFQRYYGDGVGTYTNTNGTSPGVRPDGSYVTASVREMAWIGFGMDGRVYAWAQNPGASSSVNLVQYVREVDLFTTAVSNTDAIEAAVAHVTGLYMTPYGELLSIVPSLRSSATYMGALFTVQTDYQWIGGAWVAKEVVRGPLPDTTSSPGLSAKDMHEAYAELLYGLRVKFTPAGGATAANDEFIGLMGQTGPQKNDGAVAAGSGDFAGSGFTAADVGRYLRIEKSGGDTVDDADVAVYKITAYIGATSVTLTRLSGAAWTGAGAGGTCHYTVWDRGSISPECATVCGANGMLKDNMTDVTSLSYEFYLAKTLLSDNVESIKTACGLIGPPGSAAETLYFENFPKATGGHDPNSPQARAFPGAALANGAQVLTGMSSLITRGTSGRADVRPSDMSAWGGVSAAAGGTLGFALSTDLGADAEIGSVIVRAIATYDETQPLTMEGEALAQGGACGHLHNATAAGGAPIAAAVARHSGTGYSQASGSTTGTVAAGDFLGTETAGAPDTAATTAAGNTITSIAGKFTGREKQVVRLTSGADAGYYRIASVNVDGSIATVRNLNETTASFTGTAAGLSFSIYADAVRADDTIAIGTYRLTVDRLLTTTSVQTRATPAAVITAQAWSALIPTWRLVKRLSRSVSASPPDVVANGTYMSYDGAETGTNGWPYSQRYANSVKYVFDLSDLTTGERTGRYWKFSLMPRFSGSRSQSSDFAVVAVEFYGTDGKRIDLLPDQHVDTRTAEAQFMAANVQRVDWIQAANDSTSHIAGVNGLATIGGVNGDVVTLAGGAKFLGRQVRAGAGMTADGGNNTLKIPGSDPVFTSADAGRILRLPAGPNAGYYRISSVTSGTEVVVVGIDGTAPVLNIDAGPTAYTLHEGIATGTSGDFIYVNGREIRISALSTDLTTLTLSEAQFTAAAGLSWEIRRRASIVNAATQWATSSGQVVHDPNGVIGHATVDIGTPITRTGGSAAGGSGVFTGAGFTADDVGRILVITTGTNVGHYRVSAYTSATEVTLVNARTGAAVALNADAAMTYKVVGERRFRISRYTTSLRM
jgi:hypothetical protein